MDDMKEFCSEVESNDSENGHGATEPIRKSCFDTYGSQKEPHCNSWCLQIADCMVETEAKCGAEEKEDVVKEPQHYKHGSFEAIDEMLIAFGPQATAQFCVMNAWKYRNRAPFKGTDRNHDHYSNQCSHWNDFEPITDKHNQNEKKNTRRERR